MSDRLQKLLQQRRIIEDHLGWLDREIEASQAEALLSEPLSANSGMSTGTPTTAPSGTGLVHPPPTEAAAEQILAEYQRNSDSLTGNVRRGCLIYFSAAIALLLLTVVWAYFHFYFNRSPAATPPPAKAPPSVEKR